MSLPFIVTLPPEGDPVRRSYDYQHYQDHIAIIRAIRLTKRISLTTYPIFPVIDFDDFLKQHQAYHDDMSNVLGMSKSDLLDLDQKDRDERNWWSWRNYQDHNIARNILSGLVAGDFGGGPGGDDFGPSFGPVLGSF